MAESFPLLGRHVVPASPTARAAAAVHAEASEENATQHEQAERLPEVISGVPKSAGSSQFHSRRTTSPPTKMKTANATGARMKNQMIRRRLLCMSVHPLRNSS